MYAPTSFTSDLDEKSHALHADRDVTKFSDRIELVKEMIGWDHQDNSEITTLGDSVPDAICHFCSVDSQPGPQGPPGPQEPAGPQGPPVPQI